MHYKLGKDNNLKILQAMYLTTLSEIIRDSNHSFIARRQAALQFKNCVNSDTVPKRQEIK